MDAISLHRQKIAALQRELEELEKQQKADLEEAHKKNFDGYVYVQCTFASTGGGQIGIYYREEETDLRYPVIKMKVGTSEYVRYKDYKVEFGSE